MTQAFVLMLAGYAFGAAAAVLSPGERAVRRCEYRSEIVPWLERSLYAPLIARVRLWGARTRALQSGSAHAYLGSLVIALLALLAMLPVQGI